LAQKKAKSLLSFVMPVLNEQAHLKNAVAAVFAQKLPDNYSAELILALGPSTDSTNQIAQELAELYPDIKLIQNPGGSTSAGLNLAIAKALGSIILRVDAHSDLTPGYAEIALEVLESDKRIGNVGGMMDAQGDDDFSEAVAWGYKSRFGLGGGKFHVGGKAGSVDSVYLGVFRKSVLLEAGGFDEAVVRGQDWELNQRIRALGHLVYFDPRLKVIYKPRSSWASLAAQFYKTGLWRGKLSGPDFPNISLRYLAPPVLVLLTFLWVPLWAYLLAIGFISLTSKESTAVKLRLMLVLPTMHYSWGVGFILGIIFPKLAKAEPVAS
jgi:glycosyltransferase involved in cell wall biosynthesis